jgi:biopolymer transport protein ExbB
MDKILQGFSTDSIGYGFMWTIMIFGAAALFLALERAYYIYFRCSAGRTKYLADVARLIKSGRADEVVSLSEGKSLPLAKVISTVVSARDKGKEGMEKAMDESFLTEAPRISRYLNIMLTLANLATLTGLLGTIYGLIYSFDAVANLPAAQRPTALADGIAVAMGTTFLGLVVAIPMMFAQGLFTMQSDRLVEEIEEKSIKVINLL